MHPHRSLNPAKIIQTAEKLRARITERFPGAGLARVADDLQTVAREAVDRATAFRRPIYLLRIATWLLIALIVGMLAVPPLLLRWRSDVPELMDFVQALEAGIGTTVFVGAAVIYLVSVEHRIKRRRVLAAVYELRALAHIVDMHQLTKDPDRFLHGTRTPSSPVRTMTPFQLARYLDYCDEMLSIMSKVAAFYVQEFPDRDALEAVDQVESLTTGLSRKIWQKLMIMDRLLADAPPSADAPLENVVTTLMDDSARPTPRP